MGNNFVIVSILIGCVLFSMQGYLQITYLEPYFDEWENRQRTTVYDKYFNISKSLHFTSCDYDDVLAISNDVISQ